MTQAETFVVVGLTGGIASGKSTVARMLDELGVPVIDADVLAREVVEPGAPALDEIRQAFGDDVFAEDGTLDRAELGDIVFGDDEARRALEAITHPRIAQRMMERAQGFRERGHPWVVYDAALIVENGIHEWLGALIVVAADRNTQIERIVERDDLSREQAIARVESQMPLDDKVAVADYVVDNDGTLEATRRQVEEFYQRIDQGVRTRGAARAEDEGSDS